MDGQPQNPSPDPEPHEPKEPLPESAEGHTRVGNVARLPKAVRDRLNRMLLDGVPYKQIIVALGQEAGDVTPDNITKWKSHGGYAQWLNEQKLLTQWQAKWEFAKDFVAQGHGQNLHQTVNQVIATQIYDAMNTMGPEALKAALQGENKTAIQLIQAFAQLTKAHVDCERLRVENSAASGDASALGPMTTNTQKGIEQNMKLR
jgi:hypothetical protein